MRLFSVFLCAYPQFSSLDLLCRDPIDDPIGDGESEIRRDLRSVELGQLAPNVARVHAAGVARDAFSLCFYTRESQRPGDNRAAANDSLNAIPETWVSGKQETCTVRSSPVG